MSTIIQQHSQRVQRRGSAEQPIHVLELNQALLKLRTVQAITGLSRSTIYAKLAKRQFPTPVRLGTRCTRFKAADISAWLAAQTA